MTPKIQEAIQRMHEVLNEEVGTNVVSVEIFISDHEHHFSVKTRSPAQLKSDGVSMKDIRGNWIKEINHG